jgi:multisubunit Na+/H+ antiporter MnhB subunit
VRDFLYTAGFTAMFGLLLLLWVWPVRKAAVRLLHRWGVPHPSEHDVAEALTYLKRRRYWYPPLFLGVPFLAGWLHVLPGENTVSWVIATLVGGGLLAELFAQRRPKRPYREALLVRRVLTDLVPWWALAVFVVAAVAAALRLALRHSWPDLGVTAVAVAATALIAVLAVHRPVSGTIEVDLALRLRSARVAIALGIVVAAAETDLPPGPWSWLAGLIALGVAWSMVAPLKRVPVPA